MKLARKLILATVAAMALVLSANAYFRFKREVVLFDSDMRQDHGVLGQALAQAMSQVWELRGRDDALHLLDHVSTADGRFRVIWIDGPRPPARTATRERHYTDFPVAVRGQRVGFLEISESRGYELAYLRETVVRTGLATLAAVAMAALVAAVLGIHFVGRPLHALTQKARRIGTGDLGGPLEIRQHDEIGELAREINAMCDHLAQARSSLASETEARLKAIEQLRHADRLATVGKLASGIAHELGTPLGVALVRANMIASADISGEDAREGARVIGEQVERISRIVRQLLDFARGRVARAPGELARRQPVDVTGLAEKTIALVQPLADKRQLTLDLQAAPRLPMPHLDAGQVQQVLLNLIVNSIQACDRPGKVTVQITLDTLTPPADVGGGKGDFLSLSVADQGAGIPAEILPRIFEPFFTTKSVGEGTGLGLSVAYGIVREHGGWIDVDSAVGRGSRFTIHLPVV